MLYADADGDTGGPFPQHDSVGYLGQSGHYTDAETQAVAAGGMLSLGGGYYDARLGRYLTRGDAVNGYRAQGNHWTNDVDWLGVAQTTADTAGLLPALNVPAAVVSGGISAYRGDWAGAGLSLAAVVPFEGEGEQALKLARDAKSLDRGVADAGEAVTQSSFVLSACLGCSTALL